MRIDSDDEGDNGATGVATAGAYSGASGPDAAATAAVSGGPPPTAVATVDAAVPVGPLSYEEVYEQLSANPSSYAWLMNSNQLPMRVCDEDEEGGGKPCGPEVGRLVPGGPGGLGGPDVDAQLRLDLELQVTNTLTWTKNKP